MFKFSYFFLRWIKNSLHTAMKNWRHIIKLLTYIHLIQPVLTSILGNIDKKFSEKCLVFVLSIIRLDTYYFNFYDKKTALRLRTFFLALKLLTFCGTVMTWSGIIYDKILRKKIDWMSPVTVFPLSGNTSFFWWGILVLDMYINMLQILFFFSESASRLYHYNISFISCKFVS